MGTYWHSPLTDKGYPRRPGTKVNGGGVSVVVRGRENRPQGEGGTGERYAFEAGGTIRGLGVQRTLYQWSQQHPGCNILTSPSLLESRMHSERCMSGSARGYAKPLVVRPEWRACPTQPCLATTMLGLFFRLYLVMDIYSRKMVAWEVDETETAEQAATVIRQACWAEGVRRDQLVLHADNGAPMKGATMPATLQRLGMSPSFSPDRVPHF